MHGVHRGVEKWKRAGYRELGRRRGVGFARRRRGVSHKVATARVQLAVSARLDEGVSRRRSPGRGGSRRGRDETGRCRRFGVGWFMGQRAVR